MMLRKAVIVSSFILFILSGVAAQKSIINQDLVWYGYFLTLPINSKWYFQTDVQERHYVNPTAQHQFLVRSHLHKNIGSTGWETSVGFCLFFQNPNDPNASVKLSVPELRPHFEFANKQKFKSLTLDQRYRAETRFFHNTNADRTELEDGYDFGNFRFRYRIQATFVLFKFDEARSFKLKFNDEVHLNVGKKIITNMYDQNRFFAGLSVDVMPNLNFEVGYLNWFQQKPNGSFYNRDILRFTIYQTMNVFKKAGQ